MEEHQTTILGNTTTEEEPSVEPSLVVGTQHQQQQQEEKKIIMDTDDGKEKKIADGEQRKETKLADEAIPASNDATNTIPTTTTTNANANANATTSGEYRSWDFANRKVMIKNILKYDDKRTMKKMTQAWMAATGNKVNIVKCKKPPREPWALLTMEKEEHVPILIDYINANNITTKKGDKLFAHAVEKNHGVQDDYGDDNDDDDDDDNSNHDGRDDGGGGGGGGGGGHKRSSNDITKKDERTHNKRQRVQKAVMNAKPRVITPEEVKDAIIPLWKNTYEEQLKAKEKDMIKNSVLKIVKEVKARFRTLEREAKRNKFKKLVKPYPWLLPKKAIDMAPIIKASDIVRNKCEFNFGYRYMADDNYLPPSKATKNGTSETGDTDTAMKDDTATAAATTTTTTVVVKVGSEEPSNETDQHGTDGVSKEPSEEEAFATESKAVITETRSNNELSIQQQEEDIPLKKIPSVGAMARGWSGGVSLPFGCRNIPSEALALLEIVETFLADCPMPVYDSKEHRGFWRTLTVRSSRRTRECMLIFVHAPITGGVGSKNNANVDNYSPELFESEKARLLSMVTGKTFPTTYPKLEEDECIESDENDSLEVTSVYFQEFGGISMPAAEHPVQHVYGKKEIKEQLGKCTFQISPGAFFQVNTKTAETLYSVVVEKVREVTTNPEETLCFDVCCGTGTIGLTLMKEGVVGRVVGVDISAPAIDDARVNAELNGFPNTSDDSSKTRFVAGRAEHVLSQELKRIRGKKSEGEDEGDEPPALQGKVVAVVDPARDGLHPDVVRNLRGFSQIDRLVYVSCNPTGSLIKDAGLLCAPSSKRFKGRAFRPTFAQPVDMFPYSNHCELVMVFDRLTDEELGGQPE